MNDKLAEKISNHMLKYGQELNGLLLETQEDCDEDEFKHYRRAFGRILGYMLIDVMNPIYQEFPSLKPPELD